MTGVDHRAEAERLLRRGFPHEQIPAAVTTAPKRCRVCKVNTAERDCISIVNGGPLPGRRWHHGEGPNGETGWHTTPAAVAEDWPVGQVQG